MKYVLPMPAYPDNKTPHRSCSWLVSILSTKLSSLIHRPSLVKSAARRGVIPVILSDSIRGVTQKGHKLLNSARIVKARSGNRFSRQTKNSDTPNHRFRGCNYIFNSEILKPIILSLALTQNGLQNSFCFLRIALPLARTTHGSRFSHPREIRF